MKFTRLKRFGVVAALAILISTVLASTAHADGPRPAGGPWTWRHVGNIYGQEIVLSGGGYYATTSGGTPFTVYDLGNGYRRFKDLYGHCLGVDPNNPNHTNPVVGTWWCPSDPYAIDWATAWYETSGLFGTNMYWNQAAMIGTGGGRPWSAQCLDTHDRNSWTTLVLSHCYDWDSQYWRTW